MNQRFIPVKIYNTLTRKKEALQTRIPGEVKFYSCGPTTYDFLHIGNARALVVGDLISRILRQLGYRVTFVRNFTDVDDKIIQRAQENGVDPQQHADRFIQECLFDMKELNMEEPEYRPQVTQTMPEIIAMVEQLLANGTAYEVKGEVLFHVPSYGDYGMLSKMDFEGIQHGRRVEVEAHKRHPADFVLWKPAKEKEPAWSSPWGPGRPGWHIECSAMAKKFLGDTIDLHHGGVDLIFPHHENERAQSVMANGQDFCAHWCHNEFLNFGLEKMSKSLGNVVTIRDFVEQYSGLVLRMITIMTHYRSKIEWTPQLVSQAVDEVEKIHEFIKEWQQFVAQEKRQTAAEMPSAEVSAWQQFLKDIQHQFLEELSQDFNTPGALAQVHTLIKKIRRDMTGKTQNYGVHSSLLDEIERTIKIFDLSLGLLHADPVGFLDILQQKKKMRLQQNSPHVELAADDIIQKLVQERTLMKDQKNWQRADEIRRELKDKKVILQDHPDGTTTWKYE